MAKVLKLGCRDGMNGGRWETGAPTRPDDDDDGAGEGGGAGRYEVGLPLSLPLHAPRSPHLPSPFMLPPPPPPSPPSLSLSYHDPLGDLKMASSQKYIVVAAEVYGLFLPSFVYALAFVTSLYLLASHFISFAFLGHHLGLRLRISHLDHLSFFFT